MLEVMVQEVPGALKFTGYMRPQGAGAVRLAGVGGQLELAQQAHEHGDAAGAAGARAAVSDAGGEGEIRGLEGGFDLVHVHEPIVPGPGRHAFSFRR